MTTKKATNTDVRIARLLTKEECNYFFNLSDHTLQSTSFMASHFSDIGDTPHKYNVYDILTVPPNTVGDEKTKNKNTFYTTLGRYIFNRVFILGLGLFKTLGYINKTLDADDLGDLNAKISYAILEDKVSVDTFKKFLMLEQKFQPYCNMLSAGYTTKMLTINKTIDDKKKELIKKYAKELADPKQNMYAADKMEKELLDYAKSILKNDASMDMYTSKAKASFSNNFKNMFVMKGAIKDPDPAKGYDVVLSSYMDGMSKEDYPILAKSLAEGPYKRTRKTAIGGYWEKLFLRAFEHIRLAPKGSDCGTKRTITVKLTKYMEDLLMYSFIVGPDGHLIELNSDNRDKFLNKTVQVRFASMCEYKDHGMICNACAGNLYYKDGITNIGTAAPQMASEIKLKSMKAFHNSTVQLHKIDVLKAFGLKK